MDKFTILVAELVEEGVRRDDGRNFCLFDAAEDGVHGGRIVQVDARLAGTENRDNPECGVAACREHEPDVLLVSRN